jgi:hypothetical protein
MSTRRRNPEHNADGGITLSFLHQYNFPKPYACCIFSRRHKISLLQAIFVVALAVLAHAEEKKEEQQANVSAEKKQDKRGILGLGYGAAPALAAPALSYAAPALASAPAISYAAPALAAPALAAPALSYAAPALAAAPAAVSLFAMPCCPHLPEVAFI